jgi:hypothetical protein
MLQKTRFLVSSIAVLILAGAIAPTAANAGSVGNLMHPYFAAKATNATVAIKLYNKGTTSQDVKVNDQVYTVGPHASVTIKAAAGTQVYAATASASHQLGDMLFVITPQLDGGTVSFN